MRVVKHEPCIRKLQCNYSWGLNLKSAGNWTEKFKVGDLRGLKKRRFDINPLFLIKIRKYAHIAQKYAHIAYLLQNSAGKTIIDHERRF